MEKSGMLRVFRHALRTWLRFEQCFLFGSKRTGTIEPAWPTLGKYHNVLKQDCEEHPELSRLEARVATFDPVSRQRNVTRMSRCLKSEMHLSGMLANH